MGNGRDITISATKGLANIAASATSHDPSQIVGTAIAEALSFGLDTFQTLSGKRTNELFDDRQKMLHIVEEVHKSDDFSSLVYDIWRRHAFESSEERRLYLKTILEKAADNEDRDYTNFSRIISISQQISRAEIKLLSFLYTYSNPLVSPAETVFGERRTDTRNEGEIREILKKANYKIDNSELTLILNQLGNFGLIMVAYGAVGGNVYTPIEFGRVFLSYIIDE